MKNSQEPFGFLSNGAQITGSIDGVHPTRRTGIVEATIGDDWRLMAQDDPALIYIDGDAFHVEDMTVEHLNALRSLLATDIPEQLIAAAIAYGRGDAAPPSATYAETASDPEMQARFNSLSPRAQRVASGLVELMDKYGADAVEQTLDAVLDGCDDDDPRVTLIDDGQKSGVRLERCDRSGDEPRAWLDFNVGDNIPGYTSGRVIVSVDLSGGRQGLEVIIHGNEITSSYVTDPIWTLADLRQLHSDIGKLLSDQRLIGALREQGAL